MWPCICHTFTLYLPEASRFTQYCRVSWGPSEYLIIPFLHNVSKHRGSSLSLNLLKEKHSGIKGRIGNTSRIKCPSLPRGCLFSFFLFFNVSLITYTFLYHNYFISFISMEFPLFSLLSLLFAQFQHYRYLLTKLIKYLSKFGQFENFGASTKQSTVNRVDLFWEPFLKSLTLFATVEKLLLADTPALRSFCWHSTAIYIILLRLLLAFYYHPIPPKLHNETLLFVAQTIK